MTLQTVLNATASRDEEGDRTATDKTETSGEMLSRLLAAIGVEVEDVRVVRPIDRQALQFALRELHRQAGEPAVPDAARRNDDGWTYDAARWTLTSPSGRHVQLSLIESQMVRCLFARGGEVKSREELLSMLNRPQLEAYRRNLDVTVSRLRRKVLMQCEQRLPVISARGRGYLFNAPAVIVD